MGFLINQQEEFDMLSESKFSCRLTGICVSLLATIAAGCASVPESVEIVETEEIAAIVTAVDQSQRLVTIRGPQGDEVTLEAGPEVRNLAQVQIGDTVRVIYEQAYIATLTDAEEVDPSAPVTVGAAVAELGERPGAAVGAMATMTVRIESVGPDGLTVTFSGPDGQLQAIYVQREESQAFVRSLRPGDIVELTFAQALAITVEPM